MSGLTSVDGIISGLDTAKIIDSLMAVERRPVTLLEARRERYSNENLSYQSITAKLLAIKADADALARASTFDTRVTTSSDTAILTASAAARATVGTYELTVASIARAHQVASQGFADADTTTVGTGTLVLEVNGTSTTVTVDTSNDTLEGLRDAINDAGSTVRAVIINDGGSTTPYRLLLRSANTGVANSISITNNLSGGTTPNFTTASITAPAADAGNTYAGTASAAGAFSGTSGKTYVVEMVTGGGIGAATYRVSEDGGTTWGATHTLAATIDVYDDAHGADLGAKMAFTAGDMGAGDRFTMRAFVPTVQQAADAQILMGSGAGRIELTSASNRITDAIPGVTLNLVSADEDKVVTVNVAADTESIKTRITSLVTNFNAAIDYITSQSGYNSETKLAGIFLGNSTIMGVQSSLRSILLGTAGASETYDSLFSLGLSISDAGSLSIGSTQLDAALADDYAGITKLFATSGTSTNRKIAFIMAGTNTAESASGYDVEITQAATRGKLTGTSIADPAAAPLTIDSTNKQLMVRVDGRTSQILQLTEKTYTSGAELAQEVQNMINEDEYLAGKSVSVRFVDEGANGYLEIASDAYGANSSVELLATANGAQAALGLAYATSATGTNVAGTIGGEAATGSGQLLSGDNGNAHTAGLLLRVTLAPEELAAGAEGTVTVAKGLAAKLSERLQVLTDPTAGLLKTKQDNVQDQVDSIDDHIERLEGLLEKKRASLVAQFVQLERSLALMQQQSTYLGLQLAALLNQSSESSSES